MQPTVKPPSTADVQNLGELLHAKVEECSSSQVQIKDSGLTWGDDHETSPFLAVNRSLPLCAPRHTPQQAADF